MMYISVLALAERGWKHTHHGRSYTTLKVTTFCTMLIIGGFGSLKKYNALYDSAESETVQSWYLDYGLSLTQGWRSTDVYGTQNTTELL